MKCHVPIPDFRPIFSVAKSESEQQQQLRLQPQQTMIAHGSTVSKQHHSAQEKTLFSFMA